MNGKNVSPTEVTDWASDQAGNQSSLPTIEQRLAARLNRDDHAPWMTQTWHSLLFLHWRVDLQALQATIPPSLRVDTFSGEAYVGIVPFWMRHIRPIGFPSIPGLSNFLELNVRSYVVGPDGTPGVWFHSLDCNQPLAVWGARKFFHLPYRHARMRASLGDVIDYESLLPDRTSIARYRWQPQLNSAPTQPGSLEFFLTERYWLFAEDKNQNLWKGKVEHTPYHISEVKLDHFDVGPADGPLKGLLQGEPVHACHSPGVTTRVCSLEKA